MADPICSKCNVGWVIHSHDKHCGYCGCKVFDFSVRWEKEPLIYADSGANIHAFAILVENTGAYPITFHPIQTTRDDTILFPQANDSPFEVEAGQFHAVPIQVKPAKLAQNPKTITVRAQDAPSNFESEKSLRLEASLRPEFKLPPNPIEVRYRRGTKKVTKDLHLEVLQGKFYITNIKITGGSILRVGYFESLHEKNNALKKVRLEIDCNQLSDEVNVVKLSFELRGFSQPIDKQVHIRREIEPEPPKLFVPPMNLDITQDREKTHPLTLENRGERPLTIRNIVFNGPSKLVQLPNLEFPINIEGGEHHNIEIQVSAIGIDPKTYPVNFTINSNCGDDPTYEGGLNVNVEELEAYPHYLAIDFGTTSSCCAYFGAEDVFQLIQLNSEDPLNIIPSSIIYHSQPTNGDVYEVGYGAETARTSEIDGPYYISSVKRWLGYNWRRQFPNNLELQPRDVVADILRHIIQRAEEHLDTLSTRSRIKKCVITYPTMFNRKQQEDIKQAFEKVGITDLIFIDEASAASLGAISQRRQQGDYRLLVYDFGGGTIDIVLSQVTNNGREITIEPLAHGGNPKYGGDDVTQAIVDFVLAEFGQRIERESLNLRYKIPYLSPREIWQSLGDQREDRAKLFNTSRLYNGAEELKKELSDEDEANRDFPLNVIVGNDTRPLENLTRGDINVSISKEQLHSLVANELRQTFADIDAMIRENGGHLPEIVILAGQSSKMPMVKEMMTTHFQQEYQTDDIDIELSDSPKECVAIGAAQYGMTHSSPSRVRFEIKNFRKTHASIGIMQSDGRQLVFEEIIPKGRLIPDESFGRVNILLSEGETNIDIRERFRTNDELSRIDDYTLTLPENIPREALQNACLKMAVKENGEIKVVALVDNHEYESTVERREPEFVNEI
ncbi:MAG: Hsp70 family protein [Candidatus Poribacteria bacterium]|nr:Hsp70 family protein [Candidatus Poribacteria bacterium]